MNVARLLREIETRLESLPESVRAGVLDAIREEVGRERRRLDPSATVETERERRLEAETLREVLEAINRQARLEDTIEEVLRQLSRLVYNDSCSIVLLTDSQCRVIAARGFAEPARLVGLSFRAPILDELRHSHWPIGILDAAEDARFVQIEGTPAVRSWAGVPLLVEGEVIGVLCLDRHRVDAFTDEDLHRARAVAFSAAAAIRKAQLLEQVRRYATLMEQVVAVDQAVFAGKPVAEVARGILHGALRIGQYPEGLLVLATARGPKVAAASGEHLAAARGRRAPKTLLVHTGTRLTAAQASDLGRGWGVGWPEQPLFLVPIASPDTFVGTLALIDPDGETPNDRLLESYASRAATAYRHAILHRRSAG